MTQRQETIEFWDKYHSEERSKDWIVQPDDTLLKSLDNLLADSVRGNDAVDCCRVLEIGGGSSTLARDFFSRYPQHQIISTDVSEVCIQNNIERDRKLVESSQGQLQYLVLNAIDPTAGNKEGSVPFAENGEVKRFNLILDKGCLDTFLFRSQHNVQEKLITQLLDNIHRWLQMTNGKYVILTPRSKLKLVRDYRGFHKVIKSRLAASGALDGRSEGQETVYQHVCSMNPSYRPGIDAPFPERDERTPIEQLLTQQCSKCTVLFEAFAKGQDLEGKGKSICIRRWKGHQVHCNGLLTAVARA
jgi:hypothetical protein